MIGIIDYGIGNLGSVANAVKKFGISCMISTSPLVLSKSQALILPGDGAAGEGMKNLKKFGLDIFIRDQIKIQKPFLGICLGMQLLLSYSEEGNVKCLHVIPGKVKNLKTKLKIPQIGWNNVRIENKELRIKDNMKKLFKNIPNNSYFYFVNSYVCEPEATSIITGITDYGEDFCSVLVKDNTLATQFHPEKSGEAGLRLLENFLKL